MKPRLRVIAVFGATVLALPIAAHPDHTVTRRGVLDAVSADQQPPLPNRVSITVEGDKRVIVSNGIPDHAVGRFPNPDNPHRMTAQQHRFTVPLKPVVAARPVRYGNQPFGIALNGVLFDPATAEAWKNDMGSGWHYDALGGAFSLGLDTNRGHVRPGGTYHYHGIPTALLDRLSGGKERPTLVGWAADGFPIYGKWGHSDPNDASSPVVPLHSSYRLKPGSRPGAAGQPGGPQDGVFVEDFEFVAGAGDLDECGGRFGVTPECPDGVYHYVLTEDFPFIPRLLRGLPDPGFSRRSRPPGGGPAHARPPHPEALP